MEYILGTNDGVRRNIARKNAEVHPAKSGYAHCLLETKPGKWVDRLINKNRIKQDKDSGSVMQLRKKK